MDQYPSSVVLPTYFNPLALGAQSTPRLTQMPPPVVHGQVSATNVPPHPQSAGAQGLPQPTPRRGTPARRGRPPKEQVMQEGSRRPASAASQIAGPVTPVHTQPNTGFANAPQRLGGAFSMAQASTRPTLAGPQIPGPQTPAQTQQNAGYPNGPHGLGYINSMARTLTRPMMAHPQYAGTLAPVHTQQVPGYANAGFVQEQTQLIQAQAGFTPALTNLNSSSGPVYSNQPNPASLSAGQQLPTQPQAGFTPAQSALISSFRPRGVNQPHLGLQSPTRPISQQDLPPATPSRKRARSISVGLDEERTAAQRMQRLGASQVCGRASLRAKLEEVEKKRAREEEEAAKKRAEEEEEVAKKTAQEEEEAARKRAEEEGATRKQARLDRQRMRAQYETARRWAMGPYCTPERLCQFCAPDGQRSQDCMVMDSNKSHVQQWLSGFKKIADSSRSLNYLTTYTDAMWPDDTAIERDMRAIAAHPGLRRSFDKDRMLLMAGKDLLNMVEADYWAAFRDERGITNMSSAPPVPPPGSITCDGKKPGKTQRINERDEKIRAKEEEKDKRGKASQLATPPASSEATPTPKPGRNRRRVTAQQVDAPPLLSTLPSSGSAPSRSASSSSAPPPTTPSPEVGLPEPGTAENDEISQLVLAGIMEWDDEVEGVSSGAESGPVQTTPAEEITPDLGDPSLPTPSNESESYGMEDLSGTEPEEPSEEDASQDQPAQSDPEPSNEPESEHLDSDLEEELFGLDPPQTPSDEEQIARAQELFGDKYRPPPREKWGRVVF